MYNYNDLPAFILIPMLDAYRDNRAIFPRTDLSDEAKVWEVYTTAAVWADLPEYVFEYFFPELAEEEHMEELNRFF